MSTPVGYVAAKLYVELPGSTELTPLTTVNLPLRVQNGTPETTFSLEVDLTDLVRKAEQLFAPTPPPEPEDHDDDI